jgi:hypothetical protein
MRVAERRRGDRMSELASESMSQCLRECASPSASEVTA